MVSCDWVIILEVTPLDWKLPEDKGLLDPCETSEVLSSH